MTDLTLAANDTTWMLVSWCISPVIQSLYMTSTVKLARDFDACEQFPESFCSNYVQDWRQFLFGSYFMLLHIWLSCHALHNLKRPVFRWIFLLLLTTFFNAFCKVKKKTRYCGSILDVSLLLCEVESWRLFSSPVKRAAGCKPTLQAVGCDWDFRVQKGGWGTS